MDRVPEGPGEEASVILNRQERTFRGMESENEVRKPLLKERIIVQNMWLVLGQPDGYLDFEIGQGPAFSCAAKKIRELGRKRNWKMKKARKRLHKKVKADTDPCEALDALERIMKENFEIRENNVKARKDSVAAIDMYTCRKRSL